MVQNGKKYTPPFKPGNYFHVYNHAVGSELLFQDDENYRFFLNRFSKFLSSHVELFSYCLLPNHFHLLIRVSNHSNHNKVSEQFRKLFISYSKAFNKYSSRRGTLFERHLKRICVTTDEHLVWIVFYIHRNPVHHGYSTNFRTYAWSSYRSILSKKKTDLARDEVIELFSGKREFIMFHEKNISEYNFTEGLLLE